MTTERPPPLGADASFEFASKPLKPHVGKTDFIEKSICNDASAPLGCFSLTPNFCFQVSAIRNFYFGIGKKKPKKRVPLTRLTPKRAVFHAAEADSTYLLGILVCCKWAFLQHTGITKGGLSSASDVSKFHSHFCASLKQLSSYAFEVLAPLCIISKLADTKPHFPFEGGTAVERILFSAEEPESFGSF